LVRASEAVFVHDPLSPNSMRRLPLMEDKNLLHPHYLLVLGT